MYKYISFGITINHFFNYTCRHTSRARYLRKNWEVSWFNYWYIVFQLARREHSQLIDDGTRFDKESHHIPICRRRKHVPLGPLERPVCVHVREEGDRIQVPTVRAHHLLEVLIRIIQRNLQPHACSHPNQFNPSDDRYSHLQNMQTRVPIFI